MEHKGVLLSSLCNYMDQLETTNILSLFQRDSQHIRSLQQAAPARLMHACKFNALFCYATMFHSLPGLPCSLSAHTFLSGQR